MLPSFAPSVQLYKCQPDYLELNKVLAARMRKLITAGARKKKRTAHMLTKTIRYTLYLRMFGLIVPAHPYCASKFTRHIIHESKC